MTAEVTPLPGAAPAPPDFVAPDVAEAGFAGADSGSPVVSDEVRAIAAALSQMDAAHRRLRTRLAQRLGLTVTDLTALVVIADADEPTPKLIATELGLSTGAVTTLIDRLARAGQVRRAPKAGDRRSVLVELTPSGSGTIEVISGLYIGAIAIAVATSPHGVTGHILESLRHTVDALDGAVDSPLERDLRMLA